MSHRILLVHILDLSSFLELSAINSNCITTNIMEFISLTSTKCSTCTCIVLAALYQIEKKNEKQRQMCKKNIYSPTGDKFSLSHSVALSWPAQTYKSHFFEKRQY